VRALDSAPERNSLVLMPDETRAAKPDADAALMLRFQAGDLAAFESLFERHSRALVGFAYRFVRDREVAEELAQDVFLRVCDAAGTYRPEARFTTWLYRIATNVCLNEVRKPRFRLKHQSLSQPSGEGPDSPPTEIVDDAAADPVADLQRGDISRTIGQALALLPEKQRAAFVLNKYQELSYAEVAGVLHISEKAVKSLIHRAKETLSLKLKHLTPELMK
jgi:RNA polymerase sigma-70 factor (ECF subfamily)